MKNANYYIVLNTSERECYDNALKDQINDMEKYVDIYSIYGDSCSILINLPNTEFRLLDITAYINYGMTFSNHGLSSLRKINTLKTISVESYFKWGDTFLVINYNPNISNVEKKVEFKHTKIHLQSWDKLNFEFNLLLFEEDSRILSVFLTEMLKNYSLFNRRCYVN